MINVADLPAVRNQLERAVVVADGEGAQPVAEGGVGCKAPQKFSVADLPAVKAHFERTAAPTQAIEYARAPDGPGFQSGAGRPHAIQGGRR